MNKIKGLFQIEHISEYGKPVICLFRRVNGEKILEKIKDFQHYFYVPDERGEYTTIDGVKVRKVKFNNPWDMKDAKFEYDTTYEADLSYKMRWMIDNVDEIESENYRKYYFDIETTKGTEFPNPKNPYQEVTCISFYDSYKEKMVTMTWRKDLKKKKETVEDGWIYYFNNEREMLDFFLRSIETLDPDIMIAWNIKFDMGYLYARMSRLNIDPNRMSPLGVTKYYESWRPGENYGDTSVKGRVIFDLQLGYMDINLAGLKFFSLQHVCEKELGVGKEELQDFDDDWLHNLPRLIKYNRKDVELMVKLDNKIDIIGFYDEMRNMSGVTDLTQCFYYSVITDSFMLGVHHDKVFPNKQPYVKQEKAQIEGATVREPKPGIHDNVIVLDFKGLYPSIMRTANLSKEVKVGDDYDGDTININGCRFRKDKLGIMPSLVKRFDELRDVFRLEMEKCKGGTPEWETWSRKDFAIKFLTNAAGYGVNLLSSFRMYDPDVAACITYFGRWLNEFMAQIAEEFGHTVIYGDTDSIFVKLNTNEEVSKEEMINLTIELEKEINRRIPIAIKKEFNIDVSYIRLVGEKLYRKIITPDKKKKYAGHLIWKKGKWLDKIDITGFEVKRSDTTELGAKIQDTVLKMLLADKTFEEVDEYVVKMGKSIKNREYSYSAMSKPLVINKAEYKVNMPQVRAKDWSNKNLKTSFKVGDKFLVLPVKDIMGTDVIAFEDDKQLEKISVILDMDKVLEDCLFGRMKTIYRSLGRLDEVDSIRNKINGQTALGDFAI